MPCGTRRGADSRPQMPAVHPRSRSPFPIPEPRSRPAPRLRGGAGGAGRPGPAGGSGAAGVRGSRSAVAEPCPGAPGELAGCGPSLDAPMDKYKGGLGPHACPCPAAAPHGDRRPALPAAGTSGTCGGGVDGEGSLGVTDPLARGRRGLLSPRVGKRGGDGWRRTGDELQRRWCFPRVGPGSAPGVGGLREWG